VNGLCGKEEFPGSLLIGMGTDSIEDVYPYPGVAAAFGAADDLGKDKPKPPDDDAPEEGRGRVVDTGVHQASMRR